MTSIAHSRLKRGADIVISVLALIALAPLIACLVVIVRLDSRGPAFYGQRRIGRHGAPFTLWKFRSMYEGSSQAYHRQVALDWFRERPIGDRYKTDCDSRITRVGRYLRRTDLDELPQLVNVLKGEMSLVGPRPMTAHDRPLYETWYFERESVRPGITGLWQVSGRHRLSAAQMMGLDIRYLREWSPWLDLKILALTAPTVLADIGSGDPRRDVPAGGGPGGRRHSRLRLLRLSAFGAAILLLLVALTATSSRAPARAATAPCSVQFGLMESSAPWDSSMTAIRNLDTAVNRHSSIVHWYAQWGDYGSGNFAAHQPTLLSTVRNYTSVGVTGSTPLITWEPWGPAPYTAANNTFPLQRIAAGDFDSYIDSWATGLASYGGPVMLDFAQEMDGNWYPWGYGVNGNTPADYVAAYQHVHDRFALAGATNVQWVWNVNVWNPLGVDQRIFYPGDAYVDWMAIDVFNWGASAGGWSSLAQGLHATGVYTHLADMSSRPMMLAEWASVEAGPQDPPAVSKAEWISDAATDLGAHFDRIKAVVWFSSSGTPFALDSSPQSLAAAQAAFGGCDSGSP